MPNFTFGTPQIYETVHTQLSQRNKSVSEAEVRKEMAQRAMNAINEINGSAPEGIRNQAIKQLNGMKEEYGNGVCTRIMVYNASGADLTYQTQKTEAGKWSANTFPQTIRTGEWAIAFHTKKRAAAAGSCAAVAFDMEYYDNVYVVGWDTPWSGSNHGSCYTMTTKDWMNTPWKQIIKWCETDPAHKTDLCGNIFVTYNIDQESSPVLTTIIRHKDVS